MIIILKQVKLVTKSSLDFHFQRSNVSRNRDEFICERDYRFLGGVVANISGGILINTAAVTRRPITCDRALALEIFLPRSISHSLFFVNFIKLVDETSNFKQNDFNFKIDDNFDFSPKKKKSPRRSFVSEMPPPFLPNARRIFPCFTRSV